MLPIIIYTPEYAHRCTGKTTYESAKSIGSVAYCMHASNNYTHNYLFPRQHMSQLNAYPMEVVVQVGSRRYGCPCTSSPLSLDLILLSLNDFLLHGADHCWKLVNLNREMHKCDNKFVVRTVCQLKQSCTRCLQPWLTNHRYGNNNYAVHSMVHTTTNDVTSISARVISNSFCSLRNCIYASRIYRRTNNHYAIQYTYMYHNCIFRNT